MVVRRQPLALMEGYPGRIEIYLAVETSVLDSGMIFSQSLFCIATKQPLDLTQAQTSLRLL